MSWTAPRTWVNGEVPTAATFNTHVRDNFLETLPAKASAVGQGIFISGTNAFVMTTPSKYKTAVENVNNSTTLQNDDHLVWPVAANEVWAWAAFLIFSIASGNPGFKWTFTMPSGGGGEYNAIGSTAGLDAFSAGANEVIGKWLMGSTAAITPTGITGMYWSLRGVFRNGANAGNVQFQWAQNAAVASNLGLNVGSYIDLKRLA